ncbi:Fe-S cluster assembly protein SufD [Aliikangiella marina]|uniref:Fe-S cluster assembly protein SufD n=1 Tax=Aliikangiella marina TaxID=1712262 RepID=A0A545T387_9GAMM|nr:Fe-S cluster assembly protein SufD [Aliikangiella marina]TQV71655.1 Fe-S cluster assembly protein SufD [Aliikangiella marina]
MSFTIDFENRDQLDLPALVSKPLPWLKEKQRLAFEQFKSAKTPTRKIEHWKYNDMTFLKGQSFTQSKRANESVLTEVNGEFNQITFEDAIEIFIVDGHIVSDISALRSIEGLTITNFNQTSPAQQDIINSHADIELNSKNLLANLNEATLSDGLLIEVEPKKVIKQPIYIRHVTLSSENPAVSNQKIVVQLAPSAELTLVEHFESSLDDSEQLALQQTSIYLAANSRFTHYRLNLEAETARQVSQVKTTLDRDAQLNSFYLGLGSKLNRTDIETIHAGQNAECNITGIYLPANEQAIDYHTNIEHRVPHCNSNEVFRGIIADKASATFNGKIHIFQDAQKSDAQLNNKNLLLTNQAEVNTKPELEIYADDVSCAHGATVAQLDNKSVYYLQTRGIDKQKAKKMLSIAFVQELLNQIKHESVRDYLSHLLDNYMVKVAN